MLEIFGSINMQKVTTFVRKEKKILNLYYARFQVYISLRHNYGLFQRLSHAAKRSCA